MLAVLARNTTWVEASEIALTPELPRFYLPLPGISPWLPHYRPLHKLWCLFPQCPHLLHPGSIPQLWLGLSHLARHLSGVVIGWWPSPPTPLPQTWPSITGSPLVNMANEAQRQTELQAFRPGVGWSQGQRAGRWIVSVETWETSNYQQALQS